MISNNVYLFIGGVTGTVSSWVVPAGVTGIKVECYGASGFGASTVSTPSGVYPGGSYSCVNNLAVTGGQTITFQMPSAGGSSSTWASKTGVAPTTASEGSLAVSGAVAWASQISSNVGDIKFTGGNGSAGSIYNLSGFGGQAGSSGPGADASSVCFVAGGDVFSGGGASGGTSTTANGVIPKGRYGSDTVGNGGYLDAGFSIVAPTNDSSIQASYINGLLQNNLYNYGSFGGSAVFYGGGSYLYNSYPGFIVITLIAGRKYIVVNTRGTTTFTAPSDFSSLVSFEAIGDGGNGNNSTTGTSRYGGGGGGGYSKNTSAALLANPIIAGVTQLSAIFDSTINYIRIEDGQDGGYPNNSASAFAGGNASLNTAGAGGIGVNGNINYTGGAGGAGSTTSRLNAGGGGGAAGPLGPGGAGGAANNNGANRGGGGGGGANNGGAGAAANTTSPLSSGNGGTGSSGASAGGNGNTAANPSGTTSGASGASSGSTVGGGGGGGSGFSIINNGSGGFVDNGVYRIGGGPGGRTFSTLSDGASGNYPGAGGAGGSSVSGGLGLVVMAYTPKVPYTNGNFFQLF